MTKTTVQIGPFGFYFSNSNSKLGLPMHSHYAEVTLCFEAIDQLGPPVLAATQQILRTRLSELVAQPFVDMTNEQISQALFHAFDRWAPLNKGPFDLEWLELSVRCVEDSLGHAESFTRYRTCRMSDQLPVVSR